MGWILTGLAVVLGLVSTSLAADPPKVEAMRLGFGPEAMYRQATWTPVWVDVRGGSDPGIILVELIAPDDDGVLVRQRQPVRLQAGELKTVAGFVRPGLLDAEIRARLLDEDGNPLGRPFVLSPKERLEPYSLLVLTAGKISGVKEMPSIARFRGATGTSPELVVKPLEGRWPEAWYGYEGVEAVVLETSDPQTLKPLQGPAGQALRTWVRQGGHLVVALGPGGAQEQTEEVLGEMLPASAEGSVRLTDLGSLESFAGSGQTTSGHPLTPPMTVTKLQGWDERGGVPLASALATPLVVKGPYGLGTVTVVGIDVASEPFAGWKDEKFFWDKVLGIPGQSSGLEGITGGTGGALIESGPSDLSARLHRALEAFPDVWLVPFGWVAFFIFVYILLIGPLDYLFLRKVVKRMELTWVTFPLMVVAVSALAYAGAYSVKGNSLRVNKVDALDYDQTTGAVRGSSWLTVFSPQNRDYDVSMTPLGPNLDGKDARESGARGPGPDLVRLARPGPGRSGADRVDRLGIPLRAPGPGEGAGGRSHSDLEHAELLGPLGRPGDGARAGVRHPGRGRRPRLRVGAEPAERAVEKCSTLLRSQRV